jgi:hypothetical protein
VLHVPVALNDNNKSYLWTLPLLTWIQRHQPNGSICRQQLPPYKKKQLQLLRQWYQLPRCSNPTLRNLHHASILTRDGKGTESLSQGRMWLDIYPFTWTTLRRIVGSSRGIHTVPTGEHWVFIVPPTRNSPRYLLRLNFEFQNLVYLVCWSFNKPSVPWTLSNWWTTHPITFHWHH